MEQTNLLNGSGSDKFFKAEVDSIIRDGYQKKQAQNEIAERLNKAGLKTHVGSDWERWSVSKHAVEKLNLRKRKDDRNHVEQATVPKSSSWTFLCTVSELLNSNLNDEVKAEMIVSIAERHGQKK